MKILTCIYVAYLMLNTASLIVEFTIINTACNPCIKRIKLRDFKQPRLTINEVLDRLY